MKCKEQSCGTRSDAGSWWAIGTRSAPGRDGQAPGIPVPATHPLAQTTKGSLTFQNPAPRITPSINYIPQAGMTDNDPSTIGGGLTPGQSVRAWYAAALGDWFMPIFLVCQTGAHKGKHLAVPTDKPLAFKLRKNNQDAGAVSVEVRDGQCLFTNRSTMGAQVNGLERNRAVLHAGDKVLIGKDLFLVEEDGDTFDTQAMTPLDLNLESDTPAGGKAKATGPLEGLSRPAPAPHSTTPPKPMPPVIIGTTPPAGPVKIGPTPTVAPVKIGPTPSAQPIPLYGNPGKRTDPPAPTRVKPVIISALPPEDVAEDDASGDAEATLRDSDLVIQGPERALVDTVVPTRPAPLPGAADTVVPTRPAPVPVPAPIISVVDTVVPTRPGPIHAGADTVVPTRPPPVKPAAGRPGSSGPLPPAGLNPLDQPTPPGLVRKSNPDIPAPVPASPPPPPLPRSVTPNPDDRHAKRISASRLSVVEPPPPEDTGKGLFQRMSGMLGGNGRSERARLEQLESERQRLLVESGRLSLGAGGGLGLPESAITALISGKQVTLGPDDISLNILEKWRGQRDRARLIDGEIAAVRRSLGLSQDSSPVLMPPPALRPERKALEERAFHSFDGVATQDLAEGIEVDEPEERQKPRPSSSGVKAISGRKPPRRRR